MDIQNTSDASARASLESLWLDRPSSPATRMAAAGRALHELSGDEQARWAPRFIQVFEEFHRPMNPLATDGAPLAPCDADDSNVNANLRHAMAWAFYDTLAHQGSSQALIACFHSLPRPRKCLGSNTADPAFLAQRLFESALPRFAGEGRFDALEAMAQAGAIFSRFNIAALLARNGQAMERPALREAAKAALAEFAQRDEGLSSNVARDPIAARHHPHEFLFCPHPVWREMLLDSFRRAEPDRLELANLAIAEALCNRIATATPEAVEEERRAATRTRKTFIRKAHPPAEREAARELAKMASLRWEQAASALAITRPSLIARVILEGGAKPGHKSALWEKAGLTTVDAASFLFDPHPSLTGGVQVEHKRSWPAFDDAAGRAALDGARLTFLDALALSGASRAELEAQAKLGNLPSDGLRRATDLVQVKRRMEEPQQLWLASFVGSPVTEKSKRILKV